MGFGVSKPEQARQIAAWGAEGVICGSALVRALGESGSPVSRRVLIYGPLETASPICQSSTHACDDMIQLLNLISLIIG